LDLLDHKDHEESQVPLEHQDNRVRLVLQDHKGPQGSPDHWDQPAQGANRDHKDQLALPDSWGDKGQEVSRERQDSRDQLDKRDNQVREERLDSLELEES
jgi:hypothetical protein